MPFRGLVASPEQLDRITAAFDAAWQDVSARGPFSTKIQQNRTWLAHIVLSLAEQQHANLSGAAIERFLETVPILEQPPRTVPRSEMLAAASRSPLAAGAGIQPNRQTHLSAEDRDQFERA
jgi:hypothetical protein